MRIMKTGGTLLAVAAFMLAGACTDSTERRLGLRDLRSYTLSLGPAVEEIPVLSTTPRGSRVAAAGTWFFLAGGDLWLASGGEWQGNQLGISPLRLTRLGTGGEILESRSYELADYGIEGYGSVTGVTADSLDQLWLAVYWGNTQVELLGISLATDELVLRVPGSNITRPYVAMAAEGERLYFAAALERGAEAVIAVDVTTGAIVQDYSTTIVKTMKRHEQEMRAIALSGGRLLVRGGGSEALLFDVADGALQGAVVEVPTAALGGDGDAFLGLEGTRLSMFGISPDALPTLVVEQVLTFDRGGALGLTASRGMIWVYFERDDEGGELEAAELVGYDPVSFEPMEGFALDAKTLERLRIETYSGFHMFFGLAADDRSFFLESSTLDSMYMGLPRESGIHVVDFETGLLSASFLSAGISATAICHDGTSLWAVEGETQSTISMAGLPTLVRVNADDGFVQASATGPVAVDGLIGLACLDGGLLYHGVDGRLWVEASEAGERRAVEAFSLASSGSSAVVHDNRLWLLDTRRNLLIVTRRPG